jgi:hypothetical protein
MTPFFFSTLIWERQQSAGPWNTKLNAAKTLCAWAGINWSAKPLFCITTLPFAGWHEFFRGPRGGTVAHLSLAWNFSMACSSQDGRSGLTHLRDRFLRKRCSGRCGRNMLEVNNFYPCCVHRIALSNSRNRVFSIFSVKIVRPFDCNNIYGINRGTCVAEVGGTFALRSEESIMVRGIGQCHESQITAEMAF